MPSQPRCGMSVARLFCKLLLKDRLTEATEILEEAFSTLNDSPYIRMRLAGAPQLWHTSTSASRIPRGLRPAMKYSAVLRENEMYRLALSFADTASNAAKELGNYCQRRRCAAELEPRMERVFRE